MAERQIAQRIQHADTTALQVVERLSGEFAGHVGLDNERFENLRADVIELKSDVKQLNDDAKKAISEVSKQNADNHKSNTETLQKLTIEIGMMAQRSTAERGLINFLLRNIPTGVGIAMLIYTIWWHK